MNLDGIINIGALVVVAGFLIYEFFLQGRMKPQVW